MAAVSQQTVAALFVATGGTYFQAQHVEPWDGTFERDAHEYDGPFPCVAHPPCAQWGCFATAIEAVRRWGGVLEQPEASSAWAWFGINKPSRAGGWIDAGDGVGFTCCVEQGHYGHAARKATWLYAVRTELPELRWGSSGTKMRMCQRLSKKQRLATPVPFRNLLLRLARSVVR